METRGNTQKSPAASTPAVQPADSQSDVESDALPSRGADRGDMLGIKGFLAAELGQHTDGQNDENGNDEGNADESASLDKHDEDAAAAAAAELAGEGQGGDEAAESEPSAEDEEAKAQSDAATADDPSKSTDAAAKKPDAEADKPKHEGFQARIDELTAKSKGLAERNQALEERLAAYQARDQGELVPEVLDHVESPEELSAAEQRYTALVQWAIRNPDGGKLGDKEYTAEEVRNLHAEVHTLVSQEIPRRRDYLAKRQQADLDAVNFYPWLKDTTKGAGAMVVEAVKQVPALRRLPNYRIVAADAFVGQTLRNHGIMITDKLLERLAAEAKAAGTKRPTTGAAPQGKVPATGARPASNQRPPSAPSRAGVLPPRMSPRAAAAKASGQRLRQGQGTEDDLADSIAGKL